MNYVVQSTELQQQRNAPNRRFVNDLSSDSSFYQTKLGMNILVDAFNEDILDIPAHAKTETHLNSRSKQTRFYKSSKSKSKSNKSSHKRRQNATYDQEMMLHEAQELFMQTNYKVRNIAEKLRQAKAQILRLRQILEDKDQVIEQLELNNTDLLQRIDFLQEQKSDPEDYKKFSSEQLQTLIETSQNHQKEVADTEPTSPESSESKIQVMLKELIKNEKFYGFLKINDLDPIKFFSPINGPKMSKYFGSETQTTLQKQTS